MIRVLDEKRPLDFYQRGFDLTETDRLVFDGYTMIFLTGVDSASELELKVKREQTEPYTHGNGSHLQLSG